MNDGPFQVDAPQKPGGVFYVFVRGPFGPVIVATCSSEAAAFKLAASLNDDAALADEVADEVAQLEHADFEGWVRGRVQMWRQDQSRLTNIIC